MDLSCIISSGDLELYVLGLLPEEEASKIGQLALLFPEIEEEIAQITASLLNAAGASAPAPAPALKGRIMDALAELKQAEVKAAAQTPVAAEKKHMAPVVPITRRLSRSPYRLVATVGSLVLLVGLLLLASRNEQNRSRIALLEQSVDSLQRGMQGQQQKMLAYHRTLQMFNDSNYRMIPLNNVPGKPKALAQVFWNRKTHEVYVADVSLPRAPVEKQYQLWAIVDGKPVDAGMLSDEKQMAQKMKTFPSAQAFAITLENKGGSAVPTMEQMYVMGKA